MKQIRILITLAVSFFVLFSCGAKRNTFLSRNHQALTTKYNVLFNGKQAFQEGLDELQEEHQDNFWKRLPIEPITFSDLNAKAIVNLDNENLRGFDKAEEKAVKAIQLHSMNFDGLERNRQIDDAYLLLGKSRYYTQRFIPAIEAFNYIILNYPDANLIEQTKIWRAKSNIRLENEQLAIESLKFLLDRKENEKELSKETKEQVHTALAMAYEKTDTIQQVVEHLKKATVTFKNKEQSARNLFVLGQIYNELGSKDSATTVFETLANLRKAPKKYRIHANIELVKNTPDSSSVLIKRFKKLIRNSDNRKYLDKLYYQVGVLEQKRNNFKEAKKYYNKSLQATSRNRYQKTFPYEQLGTVNFSQGNYVVANAYYDSVMQITPKEFVNEKRIRKIKRKSKALALLTKLEKTVKRNDSIVNIASMSANEQKQYFEDYVKRLKQQDEEIKQQILNNMSSTGTMNNIETGVTSFSKTGKWYFYNTQAKNLGKMQFQKRWGTRPLEDNWRFSDKTTSKSLAKLEPDDILDNSKRYNVANYLSKIPTAKTEIEKLKKDRNEALYQLGLIYKEQFKDTKKAISKLEKLQAVNEDKRLELPIKYHLYQLYACQGNMVKANQYKQIILTNYSDSNFAKVIKNPNQKLTTKETGSSIAEKYKKIYYIFKADKFTEVITAVNNMLPNVQKSKLLPKFELLKALAIGKIENKEAYKKAIEYVAFNYANTKEGIKAKKILNLLK